MPAAAFIIDTTDSVLSALACNSRPVLDRLYKQHVAELYSATDLPEIKRLVQVVVCLWNQLNPAAVKDIAPVLVDTGKIPVITSALSVILDVNFPISVVLHLLHNERKEMLNELVFKFRPLMIDAFLQLPDDQLILAIEYCESLLSEQLARRVPLCPQFLFHSMTDSSSIFEIVFERLLLSGTDLNDFIDQVLVFLSNRDAVDEQLNGKIIVAFPALAKFVAHDNPVWSSLAKRLLIEIGKRTCLRALEAILALIDCVGSRSNRQMILDAFLELKNAGKISLQAILSSRLFGSQSPSSTITSALEIFSQFIPSAPSIECDQHWISLMRLSNHSDPVIVKSALKLLYRLPNPSAVILHWPIALSLLNLRKDYLIESGKQLSLLQAIAVIDAIVLNLCSATDVLTLTITKIFDQIRDFGSDCTYIGCHDLVFLRTLITSKGDRQQNDECLLRMLKESFQISSGIMSADINVVLKYSFTANDAEVISSFNRNPWLLNTWSLVEDTTKINDLIRAILVSQIRSWSRRSDLQASILRSQAILRILLHRSPSIMQIIDCSRIIPFIDPSEAAAVLTAVLEKLVRDSQYDETKATDLIRRILFNNVHQGPLAELLHDVIAAR